jgi:hypothetical protein
MCRPPGAGSGLATNCIESNTGAPAVQRLPDGMAYLKKYIERLT